MSDIFFTAVHIPLPYYSGAVGQAFTSDRFGRRSSILLWTAIFMIGVAIQIATQRSIVQISTGRFVAGLGVGALSGESVLNVENLFLISNYH